MDLSQYTMEDLLLSAIKAEVEARDMYQSLASEVPNAFLKSRLLFLSDEEDKHRFFIENAYKKQFPDKELQLPETTPVPMPEIKMGSDVPVSEVFESAMEAEMAAHDFYMDMAGMFGDDVPLKNGFEYLASMEMGHYKLLELEREELARMEDVEMGWEMMHLGP